MYTCYKSNFNLLAILCSWGDWFETCLVGNPEDRFSRDVAHMSSWVETWLDESGQKET